MALLSCDMHRMNSCYHLASMRRTNQRGKMKHQRQQSRWQRHLGHWWCHSSKHWLNRAGSAISALFSWQKINYYFVLTIWIRFSVICSEMPDKISHNDICILLCICAAKASMIFISYYDNWCLITTNMIYCTLTTFQILY